MEAKVVAFSNNAVAYIWWVYPAKIAGCLGFSVRRVDDARNEVPLPAFVGWMPGVPGQQRVQNTTDKWPIQAFQWKDVFAGKGRFRYRVVPMLGPDPQALVADDDNALETETVEITGDYGDIQAFFNVGLISTQAITRAIDKLVSDGQYPSRTKAFFGEIVDPASPIRARLAGDVLNDGLLALPNSVQTGDHCNLALYELTDPQLIGVIENLAETNAVSLCLTNADSSEDYTDAGGKKHTRKIPDGENAPVRAELHKRGVDITDRFVPSTSIGHNKFCVLNQKGIPARILAGSVNWTATGLCTQTNNAILIRSRDVAEGYMSYWNQLVSDAALHPSQQTGLRTWCADNPVRATVDGASVTIWFSPNTGKKTKGPETPPDLAEVFALIEGAKKGILFLAFNPGSPSCMEKIQQKAEAMRTADEAFYVRGAVTDPSPLGLFTTFLTKRNATITPDVLVSGVAGVPDDFGFWEKELFKLGHAVIHDKIIVIDPFSPDCVVVTGSHNLGYKASYQNDENLLIIRGHQRLAQAYAAHVLDVTNHFSWRFKLTALWQAGKMGEAWGDLDGTPAWQDKYFDGLQLASRDAFFFT